MYSGLDQWALANGRIEHATIVHHIIPAEEKPERFYDIDNLIPVSRTSHDEIHSLYRKSKKDKQRVQAMLRDKLKSLKI